MPFTTCPSRTSRQAMMRFANTTRTPPQRTPRTQRKTSIDSVLCGGVFLLSQAHEVPENAKPDVTGFLRMELHARHLAALHHGSERLAVIGRGDGFGGDGRDEAVREVHLRAVRHAFRYGAFAAAIEAVPS